MDSYLKVVHEFYYVVGCKDFSNHYTLKVDKETEKMLYGDLFYYGETKFGRFALNKNKLNGVHEIIDRKYGTVYRVYVEANEKEDARLKAKNIIYNYLIEMTENFKNYEMED